MSIYYLFLAFILIISVLDVFVIGAASRRHIFYPLLFLVLFFLVGLRYQTGLDWLFYFNLYNGEEYSLAIEPGYYLLSYLSSFFLSYWFFQSCITILLLLSLKVFFTQYTKSYLMCIALFFSYQFIFVSEALRQICALSLVLIAFAKYYESKKTIFFLIVIMASSFHISAIIAFAIFPLISKRNLKIVKILTFIGFILAIIKVYPIDYILKFISLLPTGGYVDKFIWYSQEDYAGSVITFSLVFKIIMVMIFDYRYAHFYSIGIKKTYSKKLSLLYAAIYLMLFIDIYLGRYGTISTRLDVFFIPFFLVMLTYLFNEFKKGTSRALIFLFAMVFFATNFVGIMKGYYFENFYSPYQNYMSIFLGDDVYKDRTWDVGFYFSNKELLQ